MKYMKDIAIVVVVMLIAATGYMTYQRYYAASQNNVKIQSNFLCKTLTTC